MNQSARTASLNQFRSDDRQQVLLASLTAGNLGLNLDCASRVFLVAPWFNPFVEEQAIARVDRMGQRRHVEVYRLIMRDTVEERLLDMQQKKRALVNSAG
jgi:SNF2 family DNA or RNA helicase